MKIVAMCQGGQVRSVALKYCLTYREPFSTRKHEVLACGYQSNTPETRGMLFSWADYIVIMEPQFIDHVPIEFHERTDHTRKLFCYNVGPDQFGNAFHPKLQELVYGMAKRHGLF